MAKKISLCKTCGKPLLGGACSNDQCASFVADTAQPTLDLSNAQGSAPIDFGDGVESADSLGSFQSLVPDDFGSIEPNEIVDHTGTIGIASGELDSLTVNVDPNDGGGPAEPFAPTRIVDDEFYQQIQSMFPGDSASRSAPPLDPDRDVTPADEGERDETQSLSIRGVRSNVLSEGFLPPMRDIRFPTDTASLEKLKETNPASLQSDEYELVGKLGEGGYGIVYEAKQTALNRPVAVKVLKLRQRKTGSKSGSGTGSKTGTGSGETQRRQNSFLHEAKVTARLQHPNIVPLYDFGINPEGELFYSMKKVERRPWSSIIFSPAKLLGISENAVDDVAERNAVNKNVEIFSKVCDAMAYSHAQKIVHRDLKPDNIMIGNYGEVLLIDFGMALDFSKGTPEFSAGGTLVYMAPEMAQHFAKQREIQMLAYETALGLGLDKGSVFLDQSNLMGIGKLALRLIDDSQDPSVVEKAKKLVALDAEEKQLAKNITESADIYLLGAILYQIAVGHPPHYFPLKACKSGTLQEKSAKAEKFQKELWLACNNRFQRYTKITDPLRISLANIARRAMATQPADRFQTVEQLQAAIQGYQLQVQSLNMMELGKEELIKSKGREDYQHLLPALESFRGATELWRESKESRTLQVTTAVEYAERAAKRKDFDPGLDILDEYVDADHQGDKIVLAAREKLQTGKRIRERNRKLAWASSIAAVVLPVAAFIGFSYATASVRQEAQIAKVEKEKFEKEAITFEEIAKAQEQKASEQEVKAKEFEALARTQETAAAVQLANANKYLEDAKKYEKDALKFESLAKSQEAKAKAEETKAASFEKLALDQQKLAATREAEAKEFEIQAERSRKQAAKFQFDAEFSNYSSNILPIPLDIRKGNLSEATEKLQSLINSNAKPYFKNGWLVQHYRKKLNVNFPGTEASLKPLSENSQVIAVAPSVISDDSIVLTSSAGRPQLWKMVTGQDPQKLDWDLPVTLDESNQPFQSIIGMTRSDDGRWLALNLEQTSRKATDAVNRTHLWLIDTANGQRLTFENGDEPESNTEFIVGCAAAKFLDGSNALVTVEELDGKVGLIRRVQIVTRRITGNSVTIVGQPYPVAATTRDLSRPFYLAEIQSTGQQVNVALVYQSLDVSSADVHQLEVLRSNGDGQFAPVSKDENLVEVNIPTALQFVTNDRLVCAYGDGRLQAFATSNVTQPLWSGNQNSQRKINENESRVVKLAATDKDQLISASENGVLILWQLSDNDIRFVKRLAGQPAELTSIAIGKTDPIDGFTLVTGDRNAFVRFWQPETSKQEANVRKDQTDLADDSSVSFTSPLQVTCAAIDEGSDNVTVPATALGTDSGQVFYFDSKKMQQEGKIDPLSTEKKLELGARFIIKSPFESFDLSFDDFEALGIVGQQLVLLKSNGTFFHCPLNLDNQFPSSQSRSYDLSRGRKLAEQFVPLLASVSNQNYFFTTSPSDANQLIWWRWTGAKFAPRTIDLVAERTDAIKRLTLSPNGQWLAVIRKVGLELKTGEYRTEIYQVQNANSPNGNPLTLVTPTNSYRVGDPAFAGFSTDSQQMVLHTHKLGVDRETWLQTWGLTNGNWQETGSKRLLDDRRVSLVDWNGESTNEGLVTKINSRFYVSKLNEQDKFEPTDMKTADVGGARAVRATGKESDYYVLTSNRLRLFRGAEASDVINGEFNNARGMKVFGDQAIVLDDVGFHLVSIKAGESKVLARRETGVASMALASGRLAVIYQGSQLCRIWDVRGEQPVGLGEIDPIDQVQLSPDGAWAACLKGEELLIYKTDAKFEKESFKRPVVKGAAFHWTAGPQTQLLIAEAKPEAVAWTLLNPLNAQEVPLPWTLPTKLNELIDFELAPLTQKYLTVKTKSTVSLWAIGKREPKQLTQDEGFNAGKLNDAKSMTFSEIAPPAGQTLDDVGTRLVILASDRAGATADLAAGELSIFLLASEETAANPDTDNAIAGDEADNADATETKIQYRVVEIEGALDKTEGRELTDAQFSGDGGTLLQVDTQGITALLSEK